MCGIVGYIGHRQATPILIEGLKRLEYRGYDSAGITLASDHAFVTVRAAGRISALEDRLDGHDLSGSAGIAHTRWATHGQPTEVNAHPHHDASGRIAVVHNGIIENYQALKQYLTQQGIEFYGQTDTEVLAKLIGHFYQDDIEHALRAALQEVKGTYGLAVVCADEPDRIVLARLGSPLIVGVGDGEYIVASDASAIVAHTTQVIYLADREMAIIDRDGFRSTTLDAVPVAKTVQKIEFDLEQIELGDYQHFMLKEIVEQPESLRTAMSGRVLMREGRIHLGGVAEQLRGLVQARRIILTGCGTAWHAGLIGEYLLEDLARIPCEVEYASELRYRNPIIEPGTAVIAISQSGETADTLAALREVRDKGATTLGIVNVVGSAVARETDAGVYLHVGPEIGVASTKAFVGQVAVLTMLAIQLGRHRHLSQDASALMVGALSRVPQQIEQVLKQSDHIRQVAEDCLDQEHWLFLGRGYNYPVALEGALKLKEISYVNAEGMPAAEMKHGPIALISDGMPAVFIATRSSQYDKIIGNIEEVRSRGGRIIAVATEGDQRIHEVADDVFTVPDAPEPLQPLLTVVPLQLLAYHTAVLRGCNVDKPRNLAKSVTVE